MGDKFIPSVSGAEQVPLVPTEEAAPAAMAIPEDAMTLNGLAEAVEMHVIRQVRDIADYLGLSPTVAQAAGGNLVQAFSSVDSKVITEFVWGQSRSCGSNVLGESNS